MDYLAVYTQALYYNATTGNPATHLFLRHKIGDLASKESWIYYYEPADNNSPLVPKLPLLSVKSKSSSLSDQDYWHFSLVTENRTFKPLSDFFFSFPGIDAMTNNFEVNIDTMRCIVIFDYEDIMGNQTTETRSMKII